jgi:hypothetical protein
MVDGFHSGMSESELLALRIRQLHRHKEDLNKAANYLKKARFRSKKQFERRYKHRLQKDTYDPGDIVIVRNTCLEMTVTKFKTEPRYIGPYEVVRRTSKGNYMLKELNGTEHVERYAAFCILPYVQRHDPILTELAEENQRSNEDDNDKDDSEENEENNININDNDDNSNDNTDNSNDNTDNNNNNHEDSELSEDNDANDLYTSD